jgi:hypothetical protein
MELGIWYQLIHIQVGYWWFMPNIMELSVLIERLAATLPKLDLEGHEQEEYSTMLLWLQNQVEAGEPSEEIVQQCLAYFGQFESRAA